jgi:hypothetical protein
MNKAPVDYRQRVPAQEEMARLSLVRHRAPTAEKVTPADEAMQRSRGMRSVAAPTHQPTPAESYGCVDWFPY